MTVKNSIKQMLRTPFKTICFFVLIMTACALLTVGVNLWMNNKKSLEKFEGQFMTIGTVEQKVSSIAQKSIWDAETKNYEIHQYPEYARIYPVSVLEFEGASYIQKPEKRNYYGSYAPDYKLVGGGASSSSAFTVIEFSPLEDCVPTEAVKVEVKKVRGGNDFLQGGIILFCDHTNEDPEPLYKDSRYIACVSTYSYWAHGNSVKEEDTGRIPEYNPIEPYASQYGEDGTLLEDSMKDFAPYYEVTSGFYETEVGKRYLNLAESTELLKTTFPVTETNCTELLMPFYDGDAYIVDGNDISEEAYTKGDEVCLISDVFAENNHLKPGDQVHTRFYYTNSKNSASYNFALNGGGSFNFMMLDANGEVPAVFEEKEYEVVGIYTVNPGTSGLGGDEMIVPMNSIEKQNHCNILSYGPMNRQTTSFQIPNGTIGEYMLEWEKLGITDLDITFYDKGYTSLKAGIENRKIMSVIFSLVGICMSIGLLFLTNYLFVSSQKKKAAIERSLGVSKRKGMISMLAGIYFLLMIGSSAGGLLGFGISKNISAEDLKRERYDLTYSNGNSRDETSGAETILGVGNSGMGMAVSLVCTGTMALAGVCMMGINAR